jgi:MFS family permease
VKTVSPFRLALFWLGIQAIWGALLGISLQARALELVPGDALVAYGRLATLGAAVAAVVQIAVGPWSDARRRSGSRRIEFYIAGALGGAIAIAWFYQAPTFAQLALAYAGLQAALNIAIGPYQAIVPDFVRRERFGVASSWMAALQSAGNAAGALAASFLNDARIFAGTLDALLLSTCAVTAVHVRGRDLQTQIAPERLRFTRAFADLFISRALVYVGFFTLLGYLLFYVGAVLGASGGEAARRDSGILILIFTLTGAVGAALAARPSDAADKRVVATAGGLTVALALGLFIVSNSLPLAALATAVAGVGWGVFLVADWAIACRILPAGALATGMGVWNLAIILPQIAAPALTTWTLQRFAMTSAAAAPRWAFGLALGETLLGIAWLWRLSRSAIGK